MWLSSPQIPSPADYGLDAESSRLEIWTEFIEAPTPIISTRFLKPEVQVQNANLALDPNFSDDSLSFGTMNIGAGSAFPVQEEFGDSFNDPPIVVGKSWSVIAGRRFLIEKIDFPEVAPHLAKLPKSAAITR